MIVDAGQPEEGEEAWNHMWPSRSECLVSNPVKSPVNHIWTFPSSQANDRLPYGYESRRLVHSARHLWHLLKFPLVCNRHRSAFYGYVHVICVTGSQRC